MDRQRIIGEVAREHNVLVDPGDPILITVTINELVLEELLDSAEVTFTRVERAMRSASREQVEAARAVSEEVLAKAAHRAGEQMRVAGAELERRLGQLMRESLDGANYGAHQAREHREAAFWAAVVATGCVLAIGAFAALCRLFG